MRGAPGIAAGIEHAPEPQGWKRRPLRGYRRDLLTTARGANGEGAEIRDFGFADWAEGVPRRWVDGPANWDWDEILHVMWSGWSGE